MNEENELEQIRLKKIKAMLDTTAKGQIHLANSQ